MTLSSAAGAVHLGSRGHAHARLTLVPIEALASRIILRALQDDQLQIQSVDAVRSGSGQICAETATSTSVRTVQRLRRNNPIHLCASVP